MSLDPPHCPHCGGTDLHEANVLQSRVSVGAWLVGGFLLALLWSGSRPREVRCEQCDHVFQQSTHRSRWLSVFLWMFIALLIYSWVATYFGWDE